MTVVTCSSRGCVVAVFVRFPFAAAAIYRQKTSLKYARMHACMSPPTKQEGEDPLSTGMTF